MTVRYSITSSLIDELRHCGSSVTPDYPLSMLTTFRLGGPCRLLVECPEPETVVACWRLLASRGIKPLLLGGGSNLLISDRGIDQVVVRFVDTTSKVVIQGDVLTVSAGYCLDALAEAAVASGLEGLTACSGIPGTVGGAIAGNAGAFGQQIGDTLIDVDAMDEHGVVRIVPADELGFTYRHSRIPGSGMVIVRARFRLAPSNAAALEARRTEILALRATKHPDWRKTPTAGSFFKNIEPTSKAERRQAAGWYLEQAGALEMRVGGARTFERHANIVVAEPGATAADVKELTMRMAEAVKVKFGLDLQPEVKMIGTIP